MLHLTEKISIVWLVYSPELGVKLEDHNYFSSVLAEFRALACALRHYEAIYNGMIVNYGKKQNFTTTSSLPNYTCSDEAYGICV